mmetsp:Transcript_36603/g.67081  ORF Transcript_36603/g.67081 Transcript_36603/m.67081 type:complete len:296 (-) Transcript_36603:238-1125(-)
MGGQSSREDDIQFDIPQPQVVDVREAHLHQQPASTSQPGAARPRPVGIQEDRQALKMPITLGQVKVDAGGILSMEVTALVDFSLEVYSPAEEFPNREGKTLRWPTIKAGRMSSCRTLSSGKRLKVSFTERGEEIFAADRNSKCVRSGVKIIWSFAILAWPGHGPRPETSNPPDGAVLSFYVFTGNMYDTAKAARTLIAWGGLPQEVHCLYGVYDEATQGDAVDDRDKSCVVCLTEPRDTAMLPCGHFCACYSCATHIRLSPSHSQCPMCRAAVTDILNLHIASEEPQDDMPSSST